MFYLLKWWFSTALLVDQRVHMTKRCLSHSKSLESMKFPRNPQTFIQLSARCHFFSKHWSSKLENPWNFFKTWVSMDLKLIKSYLKTYKTQKSQRNHGLKSLKLMFFPNIYFQDFQWGFPTISESRCPDVPSSLRRGPPQGVLGDDALQTRTSGKWRRPKERRL